MIKGMLRAAAVVGTVVAAGALVYRCLLNDEAKESLRSGVAEVRRTVVTVSGTLSGEPDKEAAAAANRLRTQRQWEALGY